MCGVCYGHKMMFIKRVGTSPKGWSEAKAFYIVVLNLDFQVKTVEGF